MKTRDSIILSVSLILMAVGMLVLAGCRPPTDTQAIKTLNDASAAIKSDTASIINDFHALVDHTDSAGQSIISDGLAKANDATGEVDKVPGAVVSVTSVTKYWQERANRDEGHWWFKTIMFLENLTLWVLIPGALLLFVVVPILTSFFGAASGPLGIVLRFLRANLPLQGIEQFVNWIRGVLHISINPKTQVVVPKIPGVTISNASSGTMVA